MVQHRILKLDANGNIIRVIDVGADGFRHAFVEGMMLRLARNRPERRELEHARLDPREEKPEVKHIAVVPSHVVADFRWHERLSNHRAANEIVSFALRCRLSLRSPAYDLLISASSEFLSKSENVVGHYSVASALRAREQNSALGLFVAVQFLD